MTRVMQLAGMRQLCPADAMSADEPKAVQQSSLSIQAVYHHLQMTADCV